jgi:triosephosphate isomerase
LGKRNILVAGNWKMFKTSSEATQLVKELKENLKEVNGVNVVICPSYGSLCTVKNELKGSRIAMGAQNCHWDDEGAYTGEVSAKMLSDLGCEYVIIGHSERRNLFRETDEIINMKLKQALKEGLTPILCVGESWQERESGNTEKVLEEQLKKGLNGIAKDSMPKVVIAYEPVWAIGSGKNATPEQARQAHQYIRKVLQELYGAETGENILVIYGGSVNPENARELLTADEVDGALVGGASLIGDQFIKIIMAAKH